MGYRASNQRSCPPHARYYPSFQDHTSHACWASARLESTYILHRLYPAVFLSYHVSCISMSLHPVYEPTASGCLFASKPYVSLSFSTRAMYLSWACSGVTPSSTSFCQAPFFALPCTPKRR